MLQWGAATAGPVLPTVHNYLKFTIVFPSEHISSTKQVLKANLHLITLLSPSCSLFKSNQHFTNEQKLFWVTYNLSKVQNIHVFLIQEINLDPQTHNQEFPNYRTLWTSINQSEQSLPTMISWWDEYSIY